MILDNDNAITVFRTFKLYKDDNSGIFLDALAKVAHASRKEAGCLSFRYFQDSERQECIYLTEEYKNASVLEMHEFFEYSRIFFQKIVPIYVEEYLCHKSKELNALKKQ